MFYACFIVIRHIRSKCVVNHNMLRARFRETNLYDSHFLALLEGQITDGIIDSYIQEYIVKNVSF